jgi:hypothetical protein
MFKKVSSKETKMTYMPPIQKPITEYAAFFEMFYKSRQLAKQANMVYTHITLDVGAAIKAYHVIWNNPQAWSDIIIHLGDFHYNRNWLLHEAFSEALERLFQEQYVPEIPASLVQFAEYPPGTIEIEDLLADVTIKAYIEHYNQQVDKCLKGQFGKTPQFWALYMMMVDRQQRLHYAINMNDYNLRLLTWRESLPLCFATNRVHYSRYGTFYVQSLEYLESTHPGAKTEIEKNGLSVRRNTLGIGQAVDMAGEQSYMKNAKTAGGIRQFAAKKSTVAKWVMNRPFQARFAETLIEISGLSTTSSSTRKCVRPSEILKSNKMVENILNALNTQFLNPFQDDIDKSKLFNLVSGCPVDDEISDSILGLQSNGIQAMESFETRLTTKDPEESFFSPLKRHKFMLWKDTSRKVVVKKDGKVIESAFQRDILGILVAYSHQHKAGIDIHAALCYPLAPV